MKNPKTPLKYDAGLSPPARLSHARQACPGSRLAWLAIWLTSLLAIAPHAAWAQDRRWASPTGGTFGAAGNWLGNQPPGPGESANFTLPNTYTVDFDNSAVISSLWVRNGNVAFNFGANIFELTAHQAVVGAFDYEGNDASLSLTGGTLKTTLAEIGVAAGLHSEAKLYGVGATWENKEHFVIGRTGNGKLTIEEGAGVSSTHSIIGGLSGSHGTVMLRGNGSTWNSSSGLAVGWAGVGNLVIAEGASVSNASGTIGREQGSHGEVIVRGIDSTWTNQFNLDVGGYGHGKLTIEEGASVSSQISSIGYASGSHGEVVVRGNGSTWTINGGLSIAIGGSSGALTIEDGASVTNLGGSFIGTFGTLAMVSVHGAGSTWNNFGALNVGANSKLTIEGGASVSSMNGAIGGGFSNAQHSEVIVRGTDSAWNNSGELRVGQSGNAKLVISDGARVSNTSAFVGNGLNEIEVIVRGAGSTWTNNGNVQIGVDSVSSTRLTVEDGGMVVVNNGTGSLSLRATGILTGGGGTVLGNVHSGGIVAPGNSAGTLVIEGDFTQFVNGRVQIELGGTVASSQYDQLVVTGDAALNGALELFFINDFELRPRQWFDVLPVAGLLTGTFAGLDEGDVVGTFGGVDLFITYAAGGVSLYTIPEPSTWLLLATSGFAVLWQAAKKRRRMQSIRQEPRSH